MFAMSKRWNEWKRNGNAEVVKVAGMAVLLIATIVALVAVSPGGLDLFDSLKGF
jgi:hypothetical protein